MFGSSEDSVSNWRIMTWRYERETSSYVAFPGMVNIYRSISRGQLLNLLYGWRGLFFSSVEHNSWLLRLLYLVSLRFLLMMYMGKNILTKIRLNLYVRPTSINQSFINHS